MAEVGVKSIIRQNQQTNEFSESRPIMLFKKIFKVFRAVFMAIMIAILLINGYLLAAKLIFKNDLPKLFGFAQIIVISGSMEPAVDVGDMLIIREQSSYKVNDIVTYHSNNNLITHRVVDVSDATIYTKGDANNVTDEPVSLAAVEGNVVLLIPGVGNLLLFLKSPLGILLMLVVLFLLIEIPFVIERHQRTEK
jgi:signal peptidase